MNKEIELQLLRDARKILSTQDRLVTDWWHILEYQGLSVEQEDEEFFTVEISDTDEEITEAVNPAHCRACIIGGIDITPIDGLYSNYGDEREDAKDSLHDAVRNLYSRNLTLPFTLEEVHTVYDAAIAEVEGQE